MRVLQPCWPRIILLASLAFIGWSAVLIHSVNGIRDGLSHDVGLIVRFGKLDEAVRAFDIELGQSVRAANVWEVLSAPYARVLADLRAQVRPFSPDAKHLTSIDESVDSMEKIYEQSVQTLADAEVLDALETEYRRLRIAVTQAVTAAVKAIRVRTTAQSVALNAKWAQLNALVLVSCLMALLAGGLAVVHRRALRVRGQQQRDLAASESKYRSIVETSSDLIWSIAADRRVSYVNAAAVRRILRYEPDEVVGRPFIEFVAAAWRDESIRLFESVLADNSYNEREVELRRKDGTSVFVLVNTVPVRDERGRVVGATGTAQDISDRKLAQQTLQETNEELEKRVHERTAALLEANENLHREVQERHRAEQERKELEEQLRQSQKMEAIGTFAAGAAHDFNNSLAAILGYTGVAKRLAAENKSVSAILDSLAGAAKQATRVTKSLLTFSRKGSVEKAPVLLGQVVSESLKMIRSMLPSTIEIIQDVGESETIWVNADEGQLQQVVMNLASNARDAMPEGGQLRVVVSREKVTPSDNGVAHAARVVFEDNGSGIPQNILDRVLEPFFSTKARTKGTGLGMAVAHGIVTDHGGDIQIESTEGEGTRVSFVLPCCAAPKGLDDAEAEPTIESGHGELVIVAEDNTHVRQTIIKTLDMDGYRVREAADGAELMSLVEECGDRVELLIVDVDLPKRNGLSCVYEIRRGRPTLPAIVISGLLDFRLCQDDDILFLPKPFQVPKLRTAVSQALLQGRNADAPPGRHAGGNS